MSPRSLGRAAALTRRALVQNASLALGALALSAHDARAENEPLVVVTSFPEELTTRYEREFERLHPGAHVQFVWKQSRDALEFLSREKQGGADVYWSPSPATFATLSERGALAKLSVDRAVLPGKLGPTPLSDPQGHYEAYDIAGYGIAYNADLLRKKGYAIPPSWRDLSAPGLAGQIVMPRANKVGFSPALYDIILQSEGWEAGWALLSEIAGNAEIVSGGGGPIGPLKEGRATFALTIDFLPLQARANGLPIDFVYPAKTAFLPGHVAITASTPRPELARAFVDYVLSRDGQRLMMEADSARHPARPDAYAGKEGVADPFALSASTLFAYDGGLGRLRPGLVVALFEAAIDDRHAELARLWRAIRAVEAHGATTASLEARRLAGIVPVTAAESRDPAFLARFGDRDAIDAALLREWGEKTDAARAKAMQLLAPVEAAP